MDAIEALTSRVSATALAEPGPTDATLAQMLAAATRAPDHGRLRPWRFIVIRGAARERFGDVLAEALRRRSPDTAQAQLDRERKKPLRAPLMLAVCAVVDTASRIPAIEQILSAGAAAQNIMVAAHALRYGCFWRTGEPAYDPVVKAALGLRAQDAIVGFLYLGTHAAPPPPPPPLDAQAFALEWPGPPTAWQALGGGL